MIDCYWSLFNQHDKSRFDGLKTAQAREIAKAIPADLRRNWLAWKEGTPQWLQLTSYPELFLESAKDELPPPPADVVRSHRFPLQPESQSPASHPAPGHSKAAEATASSISFKIDTSTASKVQEAVTTADVTSETVGDIPIGKLTSEEATTSQGSPSSVPSPVRTAAAADDLTAASEFNFSTDDDETPGKTSDNVPASSTNERPAKPQTPPSTQVQRRPEAKPSREASVSPSRRAADQTASVGLSLVEDPRRTAPKRPAPAKMTSPISSLSQSAANSADKGLDLEDGANVVFQAELEETWHVDKRRSSRYRTRLDATVDLGNGQQIKTKTVDVSIGGMKLENPIPGPFKRHVAITLSRGKDEVRAECESIQGKDGTVVRFRIISVNRIDLFRTWLLGPNS